MILSEKRAFAQIIQSPIPNRKEKPRTEGLTMVIDKGMGTREFTDLMEVASAHLDILKFGFGSSTLYPESVLRQKLDIAKLYSVFTCPGGTLAEIAYHQNAFKEYLHYCVKLGFTAMEISDGTLDIPSEDRLRMIEQAKSQLSLVLSEVGKKLTHGVDPIALAKQVKLDLLAGADYVVVEGRESGENAGMYDGSGHLDELVFQEFLACLNTSEQQRLMFEAPKKSQQIDFIERFGTQVNLGNIAPAETIALECLRRGLRSDTFAFVSLPSEVSG
ncbi:phosphosulfolactate synthase [Alicyclobacillus tolerans]|uniref:Phosphosulfolactate synthase n=1 Tax=Alicyclobacillus tolerans TaxID=90970 RepID=A0A1M6Q657_9BACL|nr:phosphosulfolactate synthase [Alicyclobacillus montanus]SHK15628.1 phosphosulfolactate synthase [Alicyclobacillus montanus]